MAGEARLADDALEASAAASPAVPDETPRGSARMTPQLDELFMQFRRAPWSFGFYSAVRRVECAAPAFPRIGTSLRPNDDPVRFAQDPSLAFAPSTLSAFEPPTYDRPARMTGYFFGLLGPNGPLPLHVTEYIRERLLNDHDPTLNTFINLINHRLISLFYRAWAIHQKTAGYDRPGEDQYARFIGSLCGIGMEHFLQRDALADASKVHYCGRLAHLPRNAEGLRAILTDYFGLDVTIMEFMGQWLELPEDARCRLGESRNTGLLGSTAIVGARIWECQYKFRIRIGPMDYDDYERLLPGGESLRRLVAWVRSYLADELAWDVQLVLRAREVPACRLGTNGRVGLSTWIKSQPATHDADDLVLQVCA